MNIHPPEIEKGYLSWEGLRKFFKQVYPDEKSLSEHAGKIHARLINAAWFSRIATLDIRCQACGRDMQAQSCISPHRSSHMGDTERKLLGISLSSLKKLSPQQFMLGVTQVGPVGLRDFVLLHNKLPRKTI